MDRLRSATPDTSGTVMSQQDRRTSTQLADSLHPSRREPIDHVRVRAVTLAIFLGLITLLVVLGRDMPIEPVQPMLLRLA